MARDATRRLKQAISLADGEQELRDAAVALLRHSLRLGHRRLSLQRLEAALNCGAEVTGDDLFQCAELALRVNDVRIHERLANLSRKLEMRQFA